MNNLRFFFKDMKVELFRKLIHKFFSNNYTINKNTYQKWLDNNSKDLDQICNRIDPKLWEKTIIFQKNVILKKKDYSKKVLKEEFICRAGTEFLYFITLLKKPKVIVETGVGIGFSSLAFLSAIKENNQGRLYSSDLPYIRYEKSEDTIGYIVDEKLREKWKLYIKGDLTNLKEIIKEIRTVDIFHYDSDKTYLGTKKTFNLIKELFHKDTLIVFDDLSDHSFFYDLVISNNYKNWGIYKYKGDYIGYVGKL